MHSMYLYISDILMYKSPNPAYPGEFLHINNQRAHNNYKNIILKEPNKNPQRAIFGPRATLWTTLVCTTWNTYMYEYVSYIHSSDSCTLYTWTTHYVRAQYGGGNKKGLC